MTLNTLLLLLILFQIKHLLADFVWQSSWMVQTKGIYGHMGGICHAGMHAGLSLLILIFAAPSLMVAVLVAVGEWVVHYHLDWYKDRELKKHGYTALQKGFWALAGLDQFAHQLSYVGILWLLIQFS